MGPIFLVTSIIFNAAANGFFKEASSIQDMGSRKLMLVGIGLLLGLVNTASYLKSLETIKLDTAYAIFAAGSTLLIAGVSFVVFNESISVQKAIGLATISAGILLLWKA
jgi:multidrug transporter EmrE-like cation transporter